MNDIHKRHVEWEVNNHVAFNDLADLGKDNMIVTAMLNEWRAGRIGFESMLIKLATVLAERNDYLMDLLTQKKMMETPPVYVSEMMS